MSNSLWYNNSTLQFAKAQGVTETTPSNGPATSNFLTYQNSTLGIKVRYPSDWNGGPIEGYLTRTYFWPSAYAHNILISPTIYIDVFKDTKLDQLVHMLIPVSPGPKRINGNLDGAHRNNEKTADQ